jgi:hypothetical protein
MLSVGAAVVAAVVAGGAGVVVVVALLPPPPVLLAFPAVEPVAAVDPLALAAPTVSFDVM